MPFFICLAKQRRTVVPPDASTSEPLSIDPRGDLIQLGGCGCTRSVEAWLCPPSTFIHRVLLLLLLIYFSYTSLAERQNTDQHVDVRPTTPSMPDAGEPVRRETDVVFAVGCDAVEAEGRRSEWVGGEVEGFGGGM